MTLIERLTKVLLAAPDDVRDAEYERKLAIELLTAIREPTDAMINSQLRELKRFGTEVVEFARVESKRVWQDMIDAELAVAQTKSPASGEAAGLLERSR